jgi:hypothetical protein
MKYHKQKYIYVPGDKTQRGSCLQTTIACILDLELDQVPPFHLFFWDEEEDKTLQKMVKEMYHIEEYQNKRYESAYNLWHDSLTFFLASRGIKTEQLYDGENIVEECKISRWLEKNPDVIYTASGTSSRGVKHIVVFQNGKMIHDPHPSNEGLITIDYYTIYNKVC